MKKIAFNPQKIMSILVLLSCCDIAFITYVNNFSSAVLLFLRLILIIILGLNLLVKKNNNWSKIFILINLLFLIFICNSLLRTNSIIYYMIKLLSKPYLIVLYIQSNFKNNLEIKNILNVWKKILFTLCLIDFITIIIFPKGMYADGNYTINWFLGYKTARLVYSWALIFITVYLDFDVIKKGKKYFSKFTVFSVALCIFSAFRSQATGGSTALILYALLMFFLKMENDRNKGGKLYLLYNPKNIVLYSGIIYYLVMTIETNSYIQNIVISLFNKSTTLSNRTGIWKNCLKFFMQSPIFGKGIFTPLEYTSISKYFLGTNAHNFLLTLLISGGIIAVVMYLLMLNTSMKRKTQSYTRQEVALISSVIVFIFIGLTSSALAFSTFAFLPLILLEYEKRKEDFNEKIINEK